MNKYLPYILIIFLFAAACNSPDIKIEIAKKPESAFTEKLDEYFTALSSIQKFNGAVLVHKDGEIILREAYNMNDNINSSLHVSEDSQFDIHSISKLMGKACIVNLEKSKRLSREDKVSDYIPGFPKGDLITIQNLLNNQSGLPRNLSKEVANLIDKTPEEFVELIKKEELLFEPGTETLYSNIGYQLIYFIISEVTKKPFAKYLKDEFFTPLGMNASGAHFYIDKSNLTLAVKNHEEEDGEIVVVPNFKATSKNQAIIYSSLDDLLKFLIEVKNEPYRNHLINKAGNIGWSGGGDGILSHASAQFTSGYELVFFTNYDEVSFGGILGDVEKIMTGKPYIIPKEINRKSISLNTAVMEKYVGKYDMVEFDHDEFEIRIEKDSMAFYQNGEFGGMLKAENDTIFFWEPTDENYFVFRKIQNEEYELIFKYKGVDIVGEKK